MGWLKKAWKKVKKVVKKVGKVVKKIAKPLAIAAAIYFTGGAALGAMGSSWGALGSSIMSGLGSAGSAIKLGAKSLGKTLLKKVGTSMLSKYTGMGGGRTGPGSGDGLMEGGSGFNWGSVLGAGIDAYTSYNSGKKIQSAYNRAGQEANPFASQRGFYANKLRAFEQNPTGNAHYKFLLDQGERQLDRVASAQGLLGSGKRQVDAIKFGQGLATQMFQSERTQLSNLAGAGMTSSGEQFGMAAEAYTGGIQDATGTLGHYTA